MELGVVLEPFGFILEYQRIAGKLTCGWASPPSGIQHCSKWVSYRLSISMWNAVSSQNILFLDSPVCNNGEMVRSLNIPQHPMHQGFKFFRTTIDHIINRIGPCGGFRASEESPGPKTLECTRHKIKISRHKGCSLILWALYQCIQVALPPQMNTVKQNSCLLLPNEL